MIRVYTSSVIDASADTVWSRIRDFNGLPQWHPGIADSRIENGDASDRVGCIRHFHTRDGGMIRERLLALSDFDYSCVYEILESPMGVENYVATLKLTPVTDGARCFAEWSAEFDCAEAREQELVETIGGASSRAASTPSRRTSGNDAPTLPVGRCPPRGLGLPWAARRKAGASTGAAARRPLDRDRRADRSRLGGAARLQQP